VRNLLDNLFAEMEKLIPALPIGLHNDKAMLDFHRKRWP
jgi:hypothetical protein